MRFFPVEYATSVYVIDYARLYRAGIRGVIFDVDGTLVPHGKPSGEKTRELFERVRATGLKIILLSDNTRQRVESFARPLGCPWICDGRKPLPDGYRRALGRLGMQKNEVVYIGDQLTHDVLGANLLGLRTVLVDFVPQEGETALGKRRTLERVLTGYDKHRRNRKENEERMLFCERSPLCYKISRQKGIVLRMIKNLTEGVAFAHEMRKESLPAMVSGFDSALIKQGTDRRLQLNKVHNIDLANKSINGLVIKPGETFSFWHQVGNSSARRGYLEGRTIQHGELIPGVGGGLCNLANTIHNLVLRSPLTVTEFHSHSDALSPDHGVRVPFGAGTSVSFNYIDYRFRNDTDQDVQLVLYICGGRLFGELRSEKPFPNIYRLVEEDHHFRKEGKKYYRISQIYKETLDRHTGQVLDRELVLDNHSEVMYDYELIPKEQIRD